MAKRPDRHLWLDLLEVDGPFLSRPALDDVYDDAWPPRIAREHREILELPDELSAEWDQEALDQVNRLLTDVLGYEEGKTLTFNPGTVMHPVYDKAIVSPHAVVHSRRNKESPRMVVMAGPAASETPGQLDPGSITTHYDWPSTAVQRAALASRGLGADLALVTNGYQHLIVWVGSGVTGHAWVDPCLYRLDRQLADAFVAFLSAASVTTDADTSTAGLLRLSQDKQVDVTEKLGVQVRRAAEALVNAVSRANRNTDGELLAGVEPSDVYTGVVTVLMRTVFLLNAEERDLISSGDLWDRSYSVSGLLDELDDDFYRHQSIMRRRHGAWLRLLAAARAVYGGVNHNQMSVPTYGGNLFDPARHPFLEGVSAAGEEFDVGVVDDATVRTVLGLLQRLNGQRISYRAFSVEQIGQVYEYLLDHSAVEVAEGSIVLGLVGSKGVEPEVELADLEEQLAKGKLAEWLGKNHDPSSGKGKTAKWQSRFENTSDETVTATLAQACHGDRETIERTGRFASLLRTDARNIALVFLPGDVYVTETADRRDTGTAYTSPEFAAEIAHHALEHLVYEPGPHNEIDEAKWELKEPEEILELKVCDPAVGSGAILVAAVRYLAEKLVESRLEYGELTPRDLKTAASDPSATDPQVQARRDVVSQCIYAVDRDPMAVEMAKLSLWLITMANGRPFTFLDHAVKCGDSLLGVRDLNHLRRLHLDEDSDTQIGLDLIGGSADGLGRFFTRIEDKVSRILSLRELIRQGDVSNPADLAQREVLNDSAENLIGDLRLVADAITAICYAYVDQREGATEAAISDLLLPLAADLDSNRSELRALARLRPKDCLEYFEFFHWALEFPEVLLDGKFDAVVGNPPFLGGSRISSAWGESYREFIVRYCADGDGGPADLVAFFFRRAAAISSSFGLLATNTISQGPSRKTGLRPLCASDRGRISRADSSVRWPGRDAVYVARVWWESIARHDAEIAGKLGVIAHLDGQQVSAIESDLWPTGRLRGEPLRLPSHRSTAGEGQKVYGTGFVLDRAAKDRIIELDPKSSDVIHPYLSGSDLNSSADHTSERWVINFRQWPLDRAAGYPGAFSVIERDVKPQRAKDKRNQRRDRWWLYGEYRPSLVARIESLSRLIVMSRVSSCAQPVMVPTNSVFSDACVVFPWDDDALYGLIASTVHRVWVDRYSSTMKQDVRYSQSACFDTFPLPGHLENSDDPLNDGLTVDRHSFTDLKRLRVLMRDLDSWRSAELQAEPSGLSRFYRRYHDENEIGAVTQELRGRHTELDLEVCDAYGWGDIDLAHGFHETRHGRFFTVSTEARFELLMRLLELNFQQAAEQTGRSLEVVMREAQQHV